MADKSSTGAVHLTTLDLDISDALQSLQNLNEAIISNAEQAKISYENLFKNMNIGVIDTSNITETTKSFNNVTNSIGVTKSAIESLNLSYKTFQNTLEKSKLSDKIGTPLAKIKTDVEENAKAMRELTSAVQNGNPITKEMSEQYRELSSALKTSKGELKDAETNAIRTGDGFATLGNKAKGAGGAIVDFFNKLSDKVKWLSAYQLITLVQNAFSQIISTIKTTEDAVVDLQRVLNEDISNLEISNELYAIAEEFGQAFENVQEVALRFAQTGKSWQETIDATRATMLGLNTAELEVSTATEGLIAVMAQFDIEATELETVIDKINITADHFPVTSEKIVAALQRAGGTASAFNMTLEETIATITALAEKTGRSGENIGTALNSLIIFTSKSDNLELFAGLSDKMDETVKKFQSGSASIIEVWQQLGIEIEDLSKQQQDALFNSTAFKEFADTFEAEAAEYAADIQKIYGTAGTYRRNYLTVLLQDIGQVEQVMEGMADAEGYSLQENKKYMETLTSQWNQLVVAAQELAVQFGEAGFLSFLKGVVELTTGILKLTKSVGGLNTILSATLTLFLLIKREKINKFVSNISTSFKSVITSLKNVSPAIAAYNAQMATGATATQAMTVALKTLQLSLGNVLAILSIVYTGFSIIKGVIDSATESAKEYREEMIAAGNESENVSKDLYNVVSALENAKIGGNTDEIDEATSALLEYFNLQVSDIPLLEKRYGSLDEAIQNLIDDQYKLIKADAEQRSNQLKNSFSDVERIKNIRATQEEVNALIKTGYLVSDVFTLLNQSVNFKNAKDTIKDIDKYVSILDKSLTSEEKSSSQLYQSLLKRKEAIQGILDDIEDSDEFLKTLGEDATEWVENVTNQTEEGEQALRDFADSISDTTGIINLEEELETLANSFDELSSRVDSFQSAYSSVVDIIDEYNKTGIMTADMLQTILSMEPEYIEMLNVQRNALSLNEDALMGLVDVNDVYLQQMTALKIAKEAEAMATEMQAAAAQGLTLAEYEAGAASAVMGGQLYQAILGEIQGTNTSNELAVALQNVGASAGLASDWISVLSNRVSGMIGSMGSLLGLVRSGQPRTYYTPKTTTSKGSSPKTTAEKDRLNAEIKAWKAKKEEVEDYYKTLEDNLKKQKEESDVYYDGLIDNLKRVEETNDRINEQLDYYADRQKTLTSLEQAQSRSGIEWREKEREYQQDLADLDEDWRRTLEGWSIDDQIEEFERLKEESQNLINAQIEYLKSLKEAAVAEIEEAIEKLQERVSALTQSAGSGASGIASSIASGLSEASTLFQGNLDDMQNRLDVAMTEEEEKIRKKAQALADFVSMDSSERVRKYLFTPFNEAVTNMGKNIKEAITKNVDAASKSATSSFMTGFISPITQQIANVMKQATSAQAIAKSSSVPIIGGRTTIADVYTKSSNNSKAASSGNNTVNIFANIDNQQDANNLANGIKDVLTNPTRF